jgi:hypothetical protein
VPVSPGKSIPRDLREWDQFLAQSGIQADREVKTFTPEWDGFSVPPTGDLRYMDFGAIVFIWSGETLYGTSNATNFSITGGMPDAIIPASTKVVTSPALADDGGIAYADVAIGPTGNIDFSRFDVSGGTSAYPFNVTGWTNSGTKGISGGFVISYPKN